MKKKRKKKKKEKEKETELLAINGGAKIRGNKDNYYYYQSLTRAMHGKAIMYVDVNNYWSLPL